MKRINLYLIRHGHTLLNKMSKMQGWIDSPLTQAGIDELDFTARKLKDVKFANVYSSDLKRAMDTAELIIKENEASEVTLKPSEYFREVYFGTFEGLFNGDVWKEIAGPYGYLNQQQLIDNFSIDFVRDAMKKADPNHYAESAAELDERISKGMALLLEENEDGANVAIVTHGTLIKTLGYKYYDKPEEVVFPENGSVTKGVLDETGLHLTEYNISNKVL